MLRKPDECKSCPLYKNGFGFVLPEGMETLGVKIVGEFATTTDAKDGKPFRPFSQGGGKLEDTFKRTKTRRDNFKLTNILSCQPPLAKFEHHPLEAIATAHCKQHLERVVKPDGSNVILALGNIAIKNLTEFDTQNVKNTVGNLRGYVLESKYGLVVPSYTPSFVRRGKPQFSQYLIWDLLKAIRVRRDGFKKPGYSFQEHPSYQDIKSFYYRVKDNSLLTLSYDIETDDSADTEEDDRSGLSSRQITRIQFSIEKDVAITFPWSDEYLVFVKALMGLPNPKLGHNSYNFDNPRLRDKGVTLRGLLHDSLWMFKHWQPGLERGLQKVASVFNYPEPWKHHFHDDMPMYACHDVNSLQYIWAELPLVMKKEGVWGNYGTNSNGVIDVRGMVADNNSRVPSGDVPSGYMGHVVRFWPILDRATKEGIAVSLPKLEKLREELLYEKERIFTEIQSLISPECKSRTPRRKDKETGQISFGYAKAPKKIIQELWETYASIQDQWNGRNSPDGWFMEKFQAFAEKRGFTFEYKWNEGEGKLDIRWYKLAPFKPSSQAMVRYLEWKRDKLRESKDSFDNKLARAYTVPTDIKTGRPTTTKKFLGELLEKTGDEIIRLIIGDDALKNVEEASLGQRAGLRSIAKVLSNDVPNWIPAKDGAVHTTWGLTAASGQLDARKPNILNASKHTVVGNIFREVIEAKEGYIYVECDKKSYHVATMGYVANDSEYIRFSQLDPHSYFTAYTAKGELGLPNMGMSDEDILEICKKYKKHHKWGLVRQHSSKVIVLGNQLDLGARKAYTFNKKYFSSVEDVKARQVMLAKMFPKVEKSKREIQRLGGNEGKLILPEWQYVQRYWDVYDWKWDKKMRNYVQKHGSEAQKPIALAVQGVAFGDLRDKLIQLEDRGLNEEYGFCNSIHDSVVFNFEKSKLDKFMVDVYPILVSPSRVLVKQCCPNGLVVNVEVAIGRNWGKHTDKNPEGMQEIKVPSLVKV